MTRVRDKKEPVVMITLRVPEWLHDAIVDTAHENRVSMNEYCRQLLEQNVAPAPKGFTNAAVANHPLSAQVRRA